MTTEAIRHANWVREQAKATNKEATRLLDAAIEAETAEERDAAMAEWQEAAHRAAYWLRELDRATDAQWATRAGVAVAS